VSDIVTHGFGPWVTVLVPDGIEITVDDEDLTFEIEDEELTYEIDD